MEPNWAAENLQTIRTLMERSAVYRRALAPIMLLAGSLGLVAGLTGYVIGWNTTLHFGLLWLVAAFAAVAGACCIARRQAFKDGEPFWSPPTRRVVLAVLPTWLSAAAMSLTIIFTNVVNGELVLTLIWILFYGFGLTAAGFFMPRGIKVFGGVFVAAATLFACFLPVLLAHFYVNTNILMAFFFGVLHLAYGGYLYVSEKRKQTA